MSARFILLIFGLLCLLGNMFVIYDKTESIFKKVKTDKEIQIYQTLVLNLVLCDSLMNIYLTAVAFELIRKATPCHEFYYNTLDYAMDLPLSILYQVKGPQQFVS